MILALWLAAAWADPYRSPFPETWTHGPSVYAGHFDRAPVPNWTVQLPGKPINAASHTERTRPVFLGDTILIGSAGGDGLYQLDRRNGSLIREFKAAASVESEAVVVGDKVIFADTGGHTWCYKLDGTLVWDHDSAAPVLAPPTVDDGYVFVANVDDLVVALHAEDGSLAWRYEQPVDITRRAELALYAAPRLTRAGADLVAGFSDGTLVAFAPTTGDVRWQSRVGTGRYPDLVATPTPYQGLLFVSGYDEPLVALDLVTHKSIWEAPHGAAASAVVLGDGDDATLLHPGTDGVLRAMSVLTGLERWTWDAADDGALSMPVITPAGILVASSEGTVTLIDPANGLETWGFHSSVNLDGVTSAPVVDGRQLLFVTNAGFLYSMLTPIGPMSAVTHVKPRKAPELRSVMRPPTATPSALPVTPDPEAN